ncbi:hypothetical protein ACEPPN_018866 [Leptodophora sp. 'Broadleaf-Isolate-01']
MLDVDKEMGIAWSIPRDGRIRLSFDLGWLTKFEDSMHHWDAEEPTSERKEKSRKALESKMRTIKEFHNNLRKSGDFCIVDSNLANPDPVLAIYRPGYSNVEVYQTKSNRLVLMGAIV